jgi:uncharacterized DUF497 family protein
MTIGFEWDARKAASNLRRHRVSFQEAIGVFADPLARIVDDDDHAIDEHREIIIGHSTRQRCSSSHSSSARPQYESSVRERRPGMSGKTTRKASRRGARRAINDLRREYRFDYTRARPNRFIEALKDRTTAVVLDPDVASVFESPESVNRLLRSVIAALPPRAKSK